MPSTRPEPAAATRWWHWPHLLSLDAPLVALTWLVLWKSSYRLFVVDELIYWLLFGSVWAVYLTDRLLDSSGLIRNSALEVRHQIHYRLQRWLWPVVVVLCVVGAHQALFHLRQDVVIAGLYLAVLIGFYFAHRVLMPLQVVAILPKEIFCGILFAMGTALAPRVLAHNLRFAENPSLQFEELRRGFAEFVAKVLSYDVIPVALLFSLNIIAISCWEWRAKGAAKQPENPQQPQTSENPTNLANPASPANSQHELNDSSSLVSILPELPRALPWLLLIMAGTTGLAGILWGHPNTNPVYLSVVLASLALWTLNHFRARFSRLSLRVLGDVCLLTPWLVIPFLR